MAKVDEPSSGSVQQAEELTREAEAKAQLAVAPELVAGSLSEYVRASIVRLRAGQTGVLPVIAGLVLVSFVFQSMNSNFLTSANLVNLLVQAAVFSVLAMGVIYALLLGEIDLSIGFVSGLAGTVMAKLVQPGTDWPWWAAIAAALLVCAVIGLIQGTIIARLGLPSFVVTLAGLLFFQGVTLKILGKGGSVLINVGIINDIASGNLSPVAGWVVMLVIVAVFGALTWQRDARRRASGLVAPPQSLTGLKIGAALAGGVAIVLLCNADRGRIIPIKGVPWVVLIVFAILAVWTFVLGRTRFGRYIYAIGGNAEAARRAGINLPRIRTYAFILCSFTAGMAGVIYASRLRSISTAFEGGTLVLYAVAAAVIGGTSLFGGRGKALHGLLGGIVVAAIANGMGLVGFSAASQYMVTALVLLVAVTIDALARRGRVAGT
jgi:D-xylose transport system permease protein